MEQPLKEQQQQQQHYTPSKHPTLVQPAASCVLLFLSPSKNYTSSPYKADYQHIRFLCLHRQYFMVLLRGCCHHCHCCHRHALQGHLAAV